ncbi:MAG: hypothetical protein JNK16_03905 [Phycisphaerales bacterium]|nr:hypothetical protein [Phycisphaerales bacterium]
MSAVRRFSFSRQAFSDAAEAIRRRSEPAGSPKQDSTPGFAQSFTDLAGRAIRIASIDLDRDPWWHYFRRRR